MKGNISLTDFIKQVKEELKAAIDDKDPFFEMGDVELEVSLAVEAEGSAKTKLYVIELGGKAKGVQTHVARIKLHPFVEDLSPQTASTQGSKHTVGKVVNGAVKNVSVKRTTSSQGPTTHRPPRASKEGATVNVKAPASKPRVKPTASKPSK